VIASRIPQHVDFLGHPELGALTFLHESKLDLYAPDKSSACRLLESHQHSGSRGLVLTICENPIAPEAAANYFRAVESSLDIKRVVILNWDIKNRLQALLPGWRVVPWPYFWIEQQFEKDQEFIIAAKSRRVCFLSGNMRLHRLHIWHQIRPWVQHRDVVVVNSNDTGDRSLERFCQDVAVDLDTARQQLPWTNDPAYIDQAQQGAIMNNGSIQHPGFRSWVNIVGESTARDDTLFVTEKTWKAIRSRSLAINIGDTDTVPWLREQGFWIWDQDPPMPWRQKLGMLPALMQRDDLGAEWQRHRSALRHNLDLFQDRSSMKRAAQPALDQMLALV